MAPPQGSIFPDRLEGGSVAQTPISGHRPGTPGSEGNEEAQTAAGGGGMSPTEGLGGKHKRIAVLTAAVPVPQCNSNIWALPSLNRKRGFVCHFLPSGNEPSYQIPPSSGRRARVWRFSGGTPKDRA
ncbi:unnamed protein product [Gadus morhua 'NCC']